VRDAVSARLRTARHRLGLLGPAGVRARHVEGSLLLSADDAVGPSDRLVELALAAAARARQTDLSELSDRITAPPRWPDIWPGEHYKLLDALVAELQPQVVVEIGTWQGLGSLTLRRSLPAGGRVVTYDILPWREVPDHVLREEDFADGRLEQRLVDLSQPSIPDEDCEVLRSAALVFVDAAKDGEQERRFLQTFETVGFDNPAIVVFDDIRVWNMLAIWREIQRPKLDLTSFGHWTGTGLVDYA
jgi:predicted O-methyltransferase YrrM